MAEKEKKTVDDALDDVATETDAQGLAGVKDALAKATTAMENARTTMKGAYGKARERSAEAAEITKKYLEEAKKHLAEARERSAQLAAKGRKQADALYAGAKDQYETVAAKSREVFGKVRDRVAEVDFKQKGDQVLDYIVTNPGKAVLIALAVGFVVGYATRPRD
ncbi:MAG: ATP synthase F0 subunit B [bacterium]|nr:ATP synthase F0 subunit B [bacterium]